MLRPARLRLYLVAAILPVYLWFHTGLINNEYLSLYIFSLGWINELFALPVAVWLLRFMPGLPRGPFSRVSISS
jgi:hypothetical protein